MNSSGRRLYTALHQMKGARSLGPSPPLVYAGISARFDRSANSSKPADSARAAASAHS